MTTQMTSIDFDRLAGVNEREYVDINLRKVIGGFEESQGYADPSKVQTLAEEIISESNGGERPIKILIDPAEWNGWAINCDYRAVLDEYLSEKGYTLVSTEHLTLDPLTGERVCDGLLCVLKRNGNVEDKGYMHYLFN